MNKDTQMQKETMHKISLCGRATSTVPRGFSVAMAADFEDWLEVPAEKEYPLCKCSPKKRTVQFKVNKKTQSQGRVFFRCPDWNKPDTCNLFMWVDEMDKWGARKIHLHSRI